MINKLFLILLLSFYLIACSSIKVSYSHKIYHNHSFVVCSINKVKTHKYKKTKYPAYANKHSYELKRKNNEKSSTYNK
jgi:hypothetical protein